jgi:hypothetical protein
MTVRKWYIDQALESYQSLNRVVNELTETEVIACLEIEAGSRRRQSILTRLIQRAVRLRSQETARQLKEQFHAPS